MKRASVGALRKESRNWGQAIAAPANAAVFGTNAVAFAHLQVLSAPRDAHMDSPLSGTFAFNFGMVSIASMADARESGFLAIVRLIDCKP